MFGSPSCPGLKTTWIKPGPRTWFSLATNGPLLVLNVACPLDNRRRGEKFHTPGKVWS